LAVGCGEPAAAPAPAVPAPPTTVASVTATVARLADPGDATRAFRIQVRGLDEAERPVPNVALEARSTSPDDRVAGDGRLGRTGEAVVEWTVADGQTATSVLDLTVGTSGRLRLAARDLVRHEGRGFVRIDSVLAWLPGSVALQVVDANGRPVARQIVQLAVGAGRGALTQTLLTTDAEGRASTGWRFGPTAGTQSITVELRGGLERTGAGLTVIDSRTGLRSRGDGPFEIRGVAVPGQPVLVDPVLDTVSADALGDEIEVTARVFDAHGNEIVDPSLRLESADTAVVRVAGPGRVRSVGNGVARVTVFAGSASAELPVAVAQRAVAVAARSVALVINTLGVRAPVAATAFDRLGAPIVGEVPQLRSLTPSIADLVSPDTIVALRPGVIAVEAALHGAADTVVMAVRQVAARIALARTADTIELDQRHPLPVQVYDSGGSQIADPVLTMEPDDPSVVVPDGHSTVRAALPGQTAIRVSAGSASARYEVSVEGVALLVDGVRATAPATVTARALELTNGRIRLRWGPWIAERGGIEMDTRVGATWQPATVRGAGDWLYVTSTVVSEPTTITLNEVTPRRIGVAMRYGHHRFDPVLGRFPATYQNEPFPFTRTVWLRPREYGYFTWVQLERTMVWRGTELEVGFGGIFGPATVRSGSSTFRTDAMTAHTRFALDYGPDAAELDLDGDPLVRVLVPVPEAPMISPVFPGWGFGSVFVHRQDYRSYGAYLYAAPRSVAEPGRRLCEHAWATLPIVVRQLTPSERAACGAT
jgi:hypothetical protein